MDSHQQPQQQLYSIQDAAAQLGCSASILRKAIARGQLQPVKLGRAVRLRSSCVARVRDHGLAVPKR
jgi:excisionase family DNA binding protein